MDLTHVRWYKASYSGLRDCVEVGVWHKASYSGGNGGGCVEVSATRDTTAVPHKSDADVLYLVRDSKDPGGPKLAFTTAEWDAFLAGVRDGEFDSIS